MITFEIVRPAAAELFEIGLAATGRTWADPPDGVVAAGAVVVGVVVVDAGVLEADGVPPPPQPLATATVSPIAVSASAVTMVFLENVIMLPFGSRFRV